MKTQHNTRQGHNEHAQPYAETPFTPRSCTGGADKRKFLLRDLTYYFCRVQYVLTEQASRFAQSGTVSYAVLHELLGEPMRKGIFWLFKDISHHLFRASMRTPVAALKASTASPSISPWHTQPHTSASKRTIEDSLDWCIGYAFHECVKLREDAFQRQHYTNRLVQIQALVNHQLTNHALAQESEQALAQAQLVDTLYPLTQQTHESISRELVRILSVFEQIRVLLVRVLLAHNKADHGENDHLARLLVTKRNLVRNALGTQWYELLHGLYGEEKSALFLHAARSFFVSGRHKRAHALVKIALKKGASDKDIQETLQYAPFQAEEI